ncbi:DUF3106 domain-containing protein [Variovorax sp. ZT4R33]|uniref:DUF3106 domain-containing protein n=1 Tax=Variovorax sp. ZT4R33 TaxID=3443743 RepID=UPI003F476CFC
MPRTPRLDDRRSRPLPWQRAQTRGWLRNAMLVAMLVAWAIPGPAQTPSAPAASSAASAIQAPAKPLWRDLSTKQQQALQPLAADWDGLSEGHKRKWLTLSRNHSKLSSADKQTLHSRMTEWAALSQQERAQARFNFAEVKQVPVDERKAKWEAYQALTPEERRRLAESATPRPPGAATTIRPVPAQKLAPVPPQAVKGQHSARIQLTPPAENASGTPAPMIAAPSIPVEALTPVPATPASVAVPTAPPPRRAGMTEPPSSAP